MRILYLLFALWLPFNALAYRPLLPRPQAVRYGSGHLALRGLNIRFSVAPSPEDQFAASELASVLSAVVGKRIPVVDGAGAGRAISLIRTGDISALPTADEQPGPNSREAYRITVTNHGAEITARSSAGLFYGLQTMLQLVEGTGTKAALPEVQINDWPALAYRGFMMDTSHGPLPTEEEIKRQIDFLARWKLNQYYLYSEISIELKGYEIVPPERRYSQEQVRRVVAYARERHIDVVPCMELFGHLHDLLRLERYSELALLPYGSTLNPLNPRAQELWRGWVEQTAKLFPSPWYHIGFDETWELDSAEKGALRGMNRTRLYMDMLQKVADAVRSHGKRAIFWADKMMESPELIAELPKGAIPMPYSYRPREDFTRIIAPFANQRVPMVVASGIRIYHEIVPDFSKTFNNIDGWMDASRKHAITGVMNSGWTDSGQCLYRMALPAMAYGAVAAWQSSAVDSDRFFPEYASHIYPPAIAAEAAPALTSLAKAMDCFTAAFDTDTLDALWQDPIDPARLKKAEDNRDALRQGRLKAEQAQEHLQRALLLSADDASPESSSNVSGSLRSLLLGARTLDYLGMKYLYAVQIAGFFRQLGTNPPAAAVGQLLWRETIYENHGRIADLMDEVAELRELFREAWLAEYTPYRLRSALARWDAEFEFWRATQFRFREKLSARNPKDPLPPLDDFRR